MNSDKKYFLFPKPHFNHLFFIFYFISSLAKQYILRDMKEQDNLSIPIFKLYIYEIGDFFAAIPYLIIKKKTKSQNITKLINKDNKEKDDFIYNDIKIEMYNKTKRPITINIFIISLLNFTAQISTIIFYLIEGNQNLVVNYTNLNIILIFNIIFLYVLSKFMLNTEFYSHHYFSFTIFFICLIVITLIDFIEIANNKKTPLINSFLYISIRLFVILLYSIENILAKIMFFKYYYSPYLLLLMKAFIKLIFLIIFTIPLCFIKFENKIIFSMFKYIFIDKDSNNDKTEFIWLSIIYLFNSFFYNILNYLLIDKFSPTNATIAYIFENFGIFIINTIIDTKVKKNDVNYNDSNFIYRLILRLIMYILLIIASLIFNEFLVVNICGLANNTKLFLDYKEKNDFNLIGELNNEITPDDLISDVNIEENSRNSVVDKKENNIELTEL